MRQVFRLTIQEIIHKRILLLGFALTLLFIIFYGVGLHYAQAEMLDTGEGVLSRFYAREMGYSFLTLGWYMASFIVGALAIMAGIASISSEMESGTILALAARPLSRRDILLGKFGAYALCTVIHAFLLALAVLVLANVNFQLGLSPPVMLKGLVIFALLPLVLLAPAFWGSTLMGGLANGVAMFLIYCLVIIGGMMEQIGAIIGNSKLVVLGIVSSLIQPADSVYRMAVYQIASELGRGISVGIDPFGAASAPSLAMLIYVVIYILGFLTASLLVFKSKDL